MGVVVIGAGHAGGQLVASLRQAKFEAPITLIGSEPHLPYQRPPLTKEYMRGTFDLDRVHLRNEEFYKTQNVELNLNQRVQSIDRDSKKIQLDDETLLPYDQLVLATGSTPIQLDLPGIDANGVHLLRTIEDVDSIKSELNAPKTVAIVGGGYIGLEAASSLRIGGHQVHIFEIEGELLKRVAPPEISDFFSALHRDNGVNIHLETSIVSVNACADNEVKSVTLTTGDELNCDMVIVGVGIRPIVDLASDANLKVSNGIWVDEYCRTLDPWIYAIGDCTNHPNPLIGERLRLESVPNAMEQARVAANNLSGKSTVYASYPWFWSDQYDFKLQIVGFAAERDENIFRGQMESGTWSSFHLRQGVLIGADSINSPRDFMAARQLVGKEVDSRALGDEKIDLKTLIQR